MAATGTVIVAEAGDRVEADIWVDALRQAGIEAGTYERGVGGALGGAVTTGFARFPILVSATDLARARNVIADFSGTGALAPIRHEGAARESQRRALFVVGCIMGGIVLLAVLAKVTAG